MTEQDELRAVYQANDAAHRRFMDLLRRRASDDSIADELMAAARELQRTAEAMRVFAERFVRTGPRMRE